MIDPVVESPAWPVNELGELVLRRGTGTKTVTANLSLGSIPVDPATKTVSYVDQSLHGDWTFLQDGRYRTGTPKTILSGVKTKLDFDLSNLAFTTGSGLVVNYNEATDRFMPQTIGDVFLCNLRMKVRPSAQAGTLDITVESPTVSFNPLLGQTMTFNKASGTEHFLTVLQPLFISQDLITNGVEIYLHPISTNIEVYDYSLLLQKTYAGVAE